MSAGKKKSVDPILKADGVAREYDGFVALAPFSTEVGPGEAIAMIGPNGAGKTTFLTLAAGLLDPSGGTIEVQGAKAGSIDARRLVSYLPDTPVFYDDLSLREHIEFIASLHGVGGGEIDPTRLLERLGLSEWSDNLPSEFSRGMRQKASIALAFARPFSILLADEPFDGLDPPSRDALFDLLDTARKGGAAILVSTHRRDVVAASDRCLALRDGRLIHDGPPSDDQLGEFFGEA